MTPAKQALLYCAVILLLIGLYSGVNFINEGNVGVCYRFGRLLNYTLSPGLSLVVPYLTSVYQVQTTVQMDQVFDINCGTKSGVTVKFRNIEVVNQLNANAVMEMVRNYTVDYDKELIYKRIEHEMNQYCSRHTLQDIYIDQFDQLDDYLKKTLQEYINENARGLRIVTIRLAKPTIPADIQHNYEQIVKSQTDILNARERERKELEVIQAERRKKLEQIESLKQSELQEMQNKAEYEVARLTASHRMNLTAITSQRERELAIIYSEEQRALAVIDKLARERNATLQYNIEQEQHNILLSKMMMNSTKSKVDAEMYRAEKETKLKQMLYQTDGYVMIEIYKHFANNLKVFFGNEWPKISPMLLTSLPQLGQFLNHSSI